MDEERTFEHKRLNAELAKMLAAGKLPDHHKPQIEQQLMILGAKRCLFMGSNGTDESELHVWYESEPEWRAKIIPGWKQLLEDVANYQHVEVIPAAKGATRQNFPMPKVQINGAVTVVDDLAKWGDMLRDFIEGINMKPEDDQAFADLESDVKVLKAAEDALKLADELAMSQSPDIDALRKTLAKLSNTARDTRLMAEKVVNAEKENIRARILKEGQDKLAAHVKKLNERLGKSYMPTIPADFAGAMKSKRTFASLRDAVETTLAMAKIAANEIADRIDANLKTLREHGANHTHLFPDTAQIVLKSPEDLTSLVKVRISEHEAKEEKRREAERERIRGEEVAKLAAAQPAALPAAPPAAATPAPAAAQPATLASTTTQRQAPPQFDGAPAGDQFADERPSDVHIIKSLAQAYGVHHSRVVSWLIEMDLEAAAEALTADDATSEPEAPAPESTELRLVPVVSSQIKGIGYAPDRQLLAIQFNTGAVYHYLNVPAKVAHELATASSIGGYFTKNIKNGPYTYSKVQERLAA